LQKGAIALGTKRIFQNAITLLRAHVRFH